MSRKEIQELENPEKGRETGREGLGGLQTDLKKHNGGKFPRLSRHQDSRRLMDSNQRCNPRISEDT